MIRTMTTPAELLPPGRFYQLIFAGIDFAQPSRGTLYAAGNGTPAAGTQGMGVSQFLSNLTGPDYRVWHPWTGLVFSSDAQIFLQWYNADANNPRSINFDFGMLSSPCETYTVGAMGRTWFHEEAGYHSLVDHMYAAIIGLRGAPKSGESYSDMELFQGQHMRHLPSGGFGVPPSGHASPMGGGRMGVHH
jgi:hypothetical protein